MEIVNALRQVGCSVLDLSAVGKGAPDVLVSHPSSRSLFLVEIKTKAGKLNELQRKWHETWRGPVYVVRTVGEALTLIGVENK